MRSNVISLRGHPRQEEPSVLSVEDKLIYIIENDEDGKSLLRDIFSLPTKQDRLI